MPITSRCCLAFALLAALAACKAETPESAATTADKAPATTDSTAAKVAAVADTLNPLSSPKEELMASVKQFTSLKSYHATMRMSSGAQGEITNEVDFVAPDRFRMKMPMGTQVIIGDTMYMQVDGRTMKVPMPPGTLTRMRDPGNMSKDEASMVVEAQGSESIDGASARKYLVHHTQPEPVDVTMWIGDAGYPLQIHVEGKGDKPYASTTRYSRINDPTIQIEPPQ